MPPHPDATVGKPVPQQVASGSSLAQKRTMSVSAPVMRDFIQSPSYDEPTTVQSSFSFNAPPAMYRESARLGSFENWPVSFISPSQMAAAGFYFTKNGDIVRCAFCSVEVGHWVPGDDPLSDHRKWSPSCRFVRNVPNIGNIPIEEDENAPIDDDIGFDTCGAYGINIQNADKEGQSLEKLKVQKTRPPSCPRFVTLESRLRSFESWPVSLKLKPQTLSEAGFFYTGKGDQTLCFHCGGGLKDWEETDEPWVEHARWFSKCSFVILMKGQAFIDEVSGQKAKQEIERNMAGGNLSSSLGDLDQILNGESSGESESTAASGNSEEKTEVSETSEVVSTSSSISDGRLCKICYGGEMGVAFLPCGHVVACPQCALSLTKCASCRQPISATVRIFLS